MRVVGFDIETYLIRPGLLTPKGVCVSFAQDTTGHKGGSLFMWEAGINHLEQHLDDPDVTLVAHNGSFDWGCILAARPSLLPKVFKAFEEDHVWDTLIAEKLIRIAQGTFKFDEKGQPAKYSLAALMKHHFNEHLEGKSGEDVWRLRYSELDGVPVEQYPPEARDYAIGDAVAALRVYEKQQEIAGGAIPTLGVQHRAYLALHLSAIWGLRTDKEATEALKKDLLNKVAAARASLYDTEIIRPDGTKDMTEIRRRIEASGKVSWTPTGKIGTSKEDLLRSQDPDLKVLADSTENEKLLSSFVPVLESRLICPTYDLVESGRTSCRNPNIQQLPRAGGVRECFVAAPGWVLCSVDYSMLELCALAQVNLDLFGYSEMAEQLKADRDLHIYFGAKIIGLEYDDCFRRVKEGDPAAKNARQLAKIFNFGAGGGLGAKTFVEYARGFDVVVEEEQVRELLNLWKDTFPEMRGYFNKIGQFSESDNPRLVHPRSGFVRSGVTYTSACNSLFQERAAYGGKLALWRLAQEEYLYASSPLYGSRTVAWIHDESIVAIPYADQRAAWAAERQAAVMISAMQTVIPDVPIKAEPTMFFRWYKGAEPVYSNGVLVPSRPEVVDGKTKWVEDTR